MILPKIQHTLVILISLLSLINLSACTETKGFFASSASLASLSSSSASLGSSTSSSASSDSSTSMSDSGNTEPGRSTKPFIKDDQYIDDIADLTYAYVTFASLQNDYVSFQNQISKIAMHNGIISWETNKKTYIGFGKGLKKARLTGVRYENYKQELSNSDYAKMQDIQHGYDAE